MNKSLLKIRSIIQSSITTKELIISNDSLLVEIQNVVDLITKAFREGKNLYFCGNGGSAADAQHLAAEFSGRYYKDRKALPAEALHCNTSFITAVANDYGFDQVYARLIDGIGNDGDILIAISTSGNSENILNAIKAAKDKKMITIGMTGESGGRLKIESEYNINVPSEDTPRIQESHIMIGHIICELVEASLFNS
jgi:D-sedoheptulose 7-phosphate isomerase